MLTFGCGNDHGGTALSETDYLNSNIKPEAYFSLLELEQARDYALRVAANRGDIKKVSTNPGFQFQVLIPEAIQWEKIPLRAMTQAKPLDDYPIAHSTGDIHAQQDL